MPDKWRPADVGQTLRETITRGARNEAEQIVLKNRDPVTGKPRNVGRDGQSQTAGSGYTLNIWNDGIGGYSAYEFKIVSGSEAPTMGCASGDWRMKSALFKAAGAPAQMPIGKSSGFMD